MVRETIVLWVAAGVLAATLLVPSLSVRSVARVCERATLAQVEMLERVFAVQDSLLREVTDATVRYNERAARRVARPLRGGAR